MSFGWRSSPPVGEGLICGAYLTEAMSADWGESDMLLEIEDAYIVLSGRMARRYA